MKITALTTFPPPGDKNWPFPGITVPGMEPATKGILPCPGASRAHFHRLGECPLGVRKDEFPLWPTVLVSLSMTGTSALLEQETVELMESRPNTHHGVVSIP